MSMAGNIYEELKYQLVKLVGILFTAQASDAISGTGKPRLWAKVADKRLHFADSDDTDNTLAYKSEVDGTTVAHAGVNTASTTPGAGGGTAPAFTGTAPTRAVASAAALAGTGLTASGQVLTTTDNQTVTLNQYAGCWLIPAAHSPVLIVSHPAATGAAVAFTVLGAATTDAGAYAVYAAPTPAGTVASHTHTGAAHVHAQST